MPILDRLFYTKKEAAHLLSVSTRTIERMVEAGQLKARPVPKDLRITRKSLLALVGEEENGSAN